jgi:hypothetical protein
VRNAIAIRKVPKPFVRHNNHGLELSLECFMAVAYLQRNTGDLAISDD